MKHLFLFSLFSIFLSTVCAVETPFTFPVGNQTNEGIIIIEDSNIQFSVPNEIPSISLNNQIPGKTVLDIYVQSDTKVFAVTKGKTTDVKYETEKGNCFVLSNDTSFLTYQHLKSFKVKNDENVIEGQLVGFSGNTGSTKNDKLSIEIKNDGNLNSEINFTKPVISLPVIKAEESKSRFFVNWNSLDYVVELTEKSPILKATGISLEILFDTERDFCTPENSYVKKIKFDNKTKTYSIVLKADKQQFQFNGLETVCISKNEELQKGQKIGTGKSVNFIY